MGDTRAKKIILVEPELADLVPSYLRNRRNELPLLQSALQSRDWVTLRSIGHNLLGTALSYGFAELGALGERLQGAAEARDEVGARREVQLFVEFLDLVELKFK